LRKDLKEFIEKNMIISEKSIHGRGSSKYKSPEMGAYPVFWGNSKTCEAKAE
jgi:hypothetical protein